jgi:hypothetical protein
MFNWPESDRLYPNTTGLAWSRCIKPGFCPAITIGFAVLFTMLFVNCSAGESREQAGIGFEFEQAVQLNSGGVELSTPCIYPDTEYGGLYIAGGNSNRIFHYDTQEGLRIAVEPSDVPPGAEGVGAFCYVDGDFFYRPAVESGVGTGLAPALFQLTAQGMVRPYELPSEPLQEVCELGLIVYLGEGKLLLETRPRGPFATLDLITGNVLRLPTEPPLRNVVQTMVADYGAKEVYLIRRAADMSIYFLRYAFKGTYRGPAYIHRREFFAAAASVGDIHLIQYASGLVDAYDFRYTRLKTFDFAKLAGSNYSMFLGFTTVWDKAYLIGQRGPKGKPEGYDLLVFNLNKRK